ncbi:MAG: L-threonylcarbamoyladenylate synthase, partial [Armatimonadetes bacterium]|nr:L-threonylcarbamoyladenylate synthase [Armatimonadota bacterium]
MRTRVRAIDARDPAADVLAEAAEILKTGGLVAFPTETVYGLGASARDSAAVARVFSVKGRPSQNPLIVHVASPSAAQALAAEWPPLASRLAARFWPGPLTLVLRRGDGIGPAVAAGGDTVAL